MGLQALSGLSVERFEQKFKSKVQVKKSKDANRDLGGPPGIVGIGEEIELYEDYLSPAERLGFSININSNPETRSYSNRYIRLNTYVTDLQITKEIFQDTKFLLEGLVEFNQIWREQKEDPGDVISAAIQVVDEINHRNRIIPESTRDLVNLVYNQFIGSTTELKFEDFVFAHPEEPEKLGHSLIEAEYIQRVSTLVDKILHTIDAKLRDLESEAGSLMNYKVFHYEPELSIHDALDADMSVDELKESIVMHGRAALRAQANQDPELADGLLRTV